MTRFISTVRFSVKQDFIEEFVKREKDLDYSGMAEQVTLIKTGEKNVLLDRRIRIREFDNSL